MSWIHPDQMDFLLDIFQLKCIMSTKDIGHEFDLYQEITGSGPEICTKKRQGISIHFAEQKAMTDLYAKQTDCPFCSDSVKEMIIKEV